MRPDFWVGMVCKRQLTNAQPSTVFFFLLFFCFQNDNVRHKAYVCFVVLLPSLYFSLFLFSSLSRGYSHSGRFPVYHRLVPPFFHLFSLIAQIIAKCVRVHVNKTHFIYHSIWLNENQNYSHRFAVYFDHFLFTSILISIKIFCDNHLDGSIFQF